MADGQAPPLMRMPPPPLPPMPGPTTIDLGQDSDPRVKFDQKTGAMTVEQPDGSVIVDFSPDSRQNDYDTDGFYENLAEKVDASELAKISNELIEGIEADDRSRADWISTRSDGLRLLGLKVEQPKSATVASSAPLEGQSVVRHPLLLEANLRFQANARGELLPAAGPVKVRNDGSNNKDANSLANLLERDMNHYLTVSLPEYYPDTDRMLFYVGVGGSGFKKLYHDPIRQKPVSISVDANDIVVSNSATDLRDAKRITHVIKMRKSVLKRMQIVGAYLDIDLSEPSPPTDNEVSQEKADIEGISKQNQRTQDLEYSIYECYCELDLQGHEHKSKNGKVSGLELPYKVSLDKTSRKILEIRRNWREKDKLFMARRVFVKYPFVSGLGFWDIGLVHILGNTTNALTAAWREMLDAGMFANFPGFLYSETVGRQKTNDMRVPPGGGIMVQTGGQPIGNVVMPLPYKDPSMGLMQLVDNIAQTGQRLGGTAEINVGEGRADAPVGTTMALIEQATKVLDAVHKRLHTAQQEEFSVLKELLEEDPEALWADNKRQIDQQQKDQLYIALKDVNFVPAADPNTPSRMHRIMQAVAIKQLQAANPQIYNALEVDSTILSMIGFSNPERFFAPPPPPGSQPPDPHVVAAQAKAEAAKLQAATSEKDLALKFAIAQMQSKDKAADRIAKHASDVAQLQVETMRLEGEKIIHAHDADRDHAKHINELVTDIHKHHTGLKVDTHKHHSKLSHDRQVHQEKLENDKAIAKTQKRVI